MFIDLHSISSSMQRAGLKCVLELMFHKHDEVMQEKLERSELRAYVPYRTA